MVSKFADQASMIIPLKCMLYLVREQIELPQHHDCQQGEGKKVGQGRVEDLLFHFELNLILTANPCQLNMVGNDDFLNDITKQ